MTTNNENQSNWNQLTPEEKRVIVDKGTERPFTGKYDEFNEEGTYTCKRCNAKLYRSVNKFDAHCGWPAFDKEIPGAVTRKPDPDGMRTEILCANCGAHLGHVFIGEGFTETNTRHCVNSISMNFIPAGEQESKMVQSATNKAIFAGGCFWGMEYQFKQAPGVIDAVVGYTGGTKKNPTYQEVCNNTTGHAEAIEVTFNPEQTTYEALTKFFFEIHDPTQVNRQGPDIGEQYRSEIFYVDNAQKVTAEKLMGILEDKGYRVATKLTPASQFYPAEEYHQDYYAKTGGSPYCHIYTKRF
ncbi:MAG: bifunctional methionine sulfoxide reductase B/A protein [Candidatus Marinimicrobia bacterium]|nr:bifunctional methionine sulfoxide reductase B/A protein [Candidatus Neomarinimicrobiota bacterium]MCF7839538.1 bifunctional methionine sulfoxide reductase B/A protein [Candidatus Neomarinimicrobiota bacterium]MCF7903490.1 bifunctional methionine sulfoxide reductase B/A protein [Candidatus Neomarinimicrobiota bacterium]